jgi:O-antigen ligase
MLGAPLLHALTARIGRALFLVGVFLMLTGDWPRSTLLPGRWPVPLGFLAWPWLYPTLLALSIALLVSSGVVRVGRPTTADFLHAPLAWFGAALVVSVACSQEVSLSEWAFGGFLVVAGFTVATAGIVEDETCMRGIAVAIVAAAVLLAVRVMLWRFDEGLAVTAFHVRNNAWLGKIQLTWILTLLGPLLLAQFLAARATSAVLGFAAAWLLTGAAVYALFSRIGVLAFPVATVSLCALNARYWRRWLVLLAVCLALTVGLIAISPTVIPTRLIGALVSPERDESAVDRWDILQRSVRIVRDHPIVGIGFGTYDDIVYSKYGYTAAREFFRRGLHAHNTLLHILTETGIVGLAAWCYLWFTVVRFLYRRRREGGPLGRLHASAGLCVLLAAFVLSMTESLTAARLYAGLRLNLTMALLVVYGIRLAAAAPEAETRPACGAVGTT